MNFKTWEHTIEIWNETIKMARWEIVMSPEYVKGYKAGKERGKKEEHNRAAKYIKMLRSKEGGVNGCSSKRHGDADRVLYRTR